ncbi:hypothetical protein [Herbidospora mongoliensis]|uniref:hypothetical protein n=1 Tax=Herbidospora mongoliensis TaxID=688067 RepID=UPI0008365056|nr:hypothetical protein [Herbidospora mongoliensis]
MTLANHHRVRVTSSGTPSRTANSRRTQGMDSPDGTPPAEAVGRVCGTTPTGGNASAESTDRNRGTTRSRGAATTSGEPAERTRATASMLAGEDRSRITVLTDVPAVVHEFAEALPTGPVANSGRQVVVAVADGTWQVGAAGDGPSSAPHRGD